MTNLTETISSVDGVSTRVVGGGSGGGRTTVLLHGGLPGLSPFCGGTHLWGRLLESLAAHGPVLAPDMLASAGTEAGSGPLTVDRMVAHVAALLEKQDGPVHLVGHDLGGLVALWTAIDHAPRVASLSIVASNAASPTGDGVENLTLLSPPRPLWSKESQLWAYERLSYSHHHIDDALLDASVAAATKAGHRAVAAQDTIAADSALHVSIMRAKSRFFRVAREDGVKVPTQIIWAKNDPLVTVDHGVWLYRIIAAKQRAAQFHLINRSGSFPFREQPEEFLRLLTAFHAGLGAEQAA
ncbi:alpha/beta fold hydrolase [Mesorhizobium sp. CAU 1741]|uniref:alpha/beta fold hydrolase n=1 Tax=Mesorhizobium sp. CAU 1741 TaxID=3140366 RepID=UPI00325B81E6